MYYNPSIIGCFSNYFVTVKQNEKNIVYKMIVPGVDKQNINISISGKFLTVTTKDKTAFGSKFYYEDKFNYSEKCVIVDATSKLTNGVLTITIPLKTENVEQTKSIAVE